jgi:hypothetical protein
MHCAYLNRIHEPACTNTSITATTLATTLQARTDVNRYKGAAADIVVLGHPFVEMVSQRRAAGAANLPKLGINNRTKSRTFVKAQALVAITALVAQRYASTKAAGVKRKRSAPDADTADGQQQDDGQQPDQHTTTAATAATAVAAEAGSSACGAPVTVQRCRTDAATVATQLAWLTTAEPVPEEEWDYEVAYDEGGVMAVQEVQEVA